MNKKTIVGITIAILAIAGIFYYATRANAPKGMTSTETGQQAASATKLPSAPFGTTVGSINAISTSTVAIVDDAGTHATYVVGNETVFFKTANIALSDLSKDETVVIGVQPKTGNISSIVAFKNKSDAPTVAAQNKESVFLGSVKSVAGNVLKAVDASTGATKTFDVGAGVAVSSIERISVPAIKKGDTARINWYNQSDVIRAAGIYVTS